MMDEAKEREERYLRRLLAYRVNMPHAYYDDGEASGEEHGISIDFMREPAADIDAKLRALNVARAALAQPEPEPEQWLPMPSGFASAWLTNGAPLHPLTVNLVVRFARALAAKLSAAEQKYGYSDGWASKDWMDECRAKLLEHVAKGDPRDVAAYCAFLWHHGEPTCANGAQPEPEHKGMKLECRLVERGADYMTISMTAKDAEPEPELPDAELVKAYLDANDAYWRATDEMPKPPDKWRTGTATEATMAGLRAVFAILADRKRRNQS